MSDTKELAAPQEFSDEVIERAKSGPAGDFTVARERPTYTVTIPGQGGRTVQVRVPDKSACWSLQDKFLRSAAFNVGVSPKTGVVTVTNEAGQHVARYANRDDARKRLEAAEIEIEALAGHDRVWPENAEIVNAAGEPATPKPRKGGRPRKNAEIVNE